MSTATGVLALAGGVLLVIGATEVFVDGLLDLGRTLGVAPFVTVALPGFKTENLAAGIAANAKGLPSAAAERSWAASPSSPWRSLAREA